jgi:hypothetical protein
MIYNWFDRESHPSDELIHWQDRDFFGRGWGLTHSTHKTFDEYVDALRAAYDLIHGENIDPKIKAAYDLLLGAQAHKTSMEEGEKEAGEDL